MQVGVTRIEPEWGNCRLSLDVRPGAEGASSASQDHDFDTGIFIQEIKRVLELKPQLPIHRVQDFRSVQCNRCD